jgi:hypothetical protein
MRTHGYLIVNYDKADNPTTQSEFMTEYNDAIVAARKSVESPDTPDVQTSRIFYAVEDTRQAAKISDSRPARTLIRKP